MQCEVLSAHRTHGSLLCKEDLPKYCATVTMNSLDKFMENAGNINKLRRILFAVSHLPQEMPNYWQTIKDYSQAELSVSELQTAVQNLEYLNIAAFATDKQLLGDICKDSVGVVLISARQKYGTIPEQIAQESWSCILNHQVHSLLHITEKCVLVLGMVATLCSIMVSMH